MVHFTTLDISDVQRKADHLPLLKRVGMLKLATDFTSEQDVGCMLPPELGLHSNRIPFPDPTINITNLKNLSLNISDSASNLLPGCGLDALIFSCTSGAIAIGEGRLKAIINEVLPNIPVTNPVLAVRSALSHLGALSISIVTPYDETISDVVAQHFIDQGYNVQNVANLGVDDDVEIQQISEETIFLSALRACHSTSDALFISCTGLRTANVIEKIEKELGRPVVTSNQATAWHVAKLLGSQKPLSGFGRLFR